MKIIHTADWHLGQTFFDYDRKAEHACFLNWLRQQIRIFRADVLLVAGDIFDSSNPSAESQKMYYHFLRDVTTENPDLQVILIAGNHDSAARLEAPNPLLESIHVAVRGVVKRTDEGEIDFSHLIVPFHKGGCCLAVPYLRQGDYPDAATYQEGVEKMYKTLYEQAKDTDGPVVAMGHLQATGSEISENDRSERTLIGGLECVSPDAFCREIAYTALGHLHRAQRVSGRENVRYAGAPLPMSFAEKNNQQGVTAVVITKESTQIERIAFEAPVKLLSIPTQPLPLEEALEEIARLPEGEIRETSPYIEIKILVTEPEPSLRHTIEEALKTKSVRLARIAAVAPERTSVSAVIGYEQLQSIHPMEIAEDIYRRKYGGEEMPGKMKTLLQEIIREVEL
ncbi:MAG: exonuclease SbcCD subunit D C-terminal domain-containing protein [Tannerellaceae bacterium]|jgi:exonuclease SbcD|nr:exonuclease SbcCD subunit D C-terminal domain-containing protein [Tannerellaceae bacterium]